MPNDFSYEIHNISDAPQAKICINFTGFIKILVLNLCESSKISPAPRGKSYFSNSGRSPLSG